MTHIVPLEVDDFLVTKPRIPEPIEVLKLATEKTSEVEALSALWENSPFPNEEPVIPYVRDEEKEAAFKERCSRELALQKPTVCPTDYVISNIVPTKGTDLAKSKVRLRDGSKVLPLGYKALDQLETFFGNYEPRIVADPLAPNKSSTPWELQQLVRVWKAQEFVAHIHQNIRGNSSLLMVFADTPVLHNSGVITIRAAFVPVESLKFSDLEHPQWLKEILETPVFKRTNFARTLGPTHFKNRS